MDSLGGIADWWIARQQIRVEIVALSGTFAHPVAWAVGLLAAASVLLGAAVHVTEFSADGYALPTLAADQDVTRPPAFAPPSTHRDGPAAFEIHPADHQQASLRTR